MEEQNSRIAQEVVGIVAAARSNIAMVVAAVHVRVENEDGTLRGPVLVEDPRFNG